MSELSRINFGIEKELHNDFQLYCNVKGETITQNIKSYITKCIAENSATLDMLKEQRKKLNGITE